MRAEKVAQLKAMVKGSYEIAAEHFAATRTKAPGADFRWAAGQINEDDVVLDAGCGSGRLLEWIKIKPEAYSGIDQSTALIAIAKTDHPDYNFVTGDLTNDSILPSEKFSLIFCSAVIGHIPGQDSRYQALRNLWLASLPGGRLVISFWKFRGKYRRQLWQIWYRKILGKHRYGWLDIVFPWKDDDGKEVATRYYRLFTKRGFRQEIEAAGWRIVSDNDSGYNYWIIAEKR